MRLILMRHCKSSGTTPGLADHDRFLNKRGRQSAEALGDWLRARGYHPDVALISSSRRTMETYSCLNLTCESRYKNRLYHAEPEDIAAVVTETDVPCALVIGHNPGIGAFAHELVGHGVDHDKFWDYPTGATLVVDFEEGHRWRGTATDFVTPRDLLEGQSG
ncbi:MAG: histidine phosphatase family protein [Marinovum sp.]|nr:histidine phosphatase family protein [Marinovum sp.]